MRKKKTLGPGQVLLLVCFHCLELRTNGRPNLAFVNAMISAAAGHIELLERNQPAK
jgi:hypothetical protein